MKSKPDIMVVDDELIVREALYHWFRKNGYTVDMAGSGEEALEKMAGSYYDVFFIDIRMPGMNGLELLEKIKAEYPQAIVIIITAYGSIESAVQAMQIGAADYIVKPFKNDYLALVLEKIHQQLRRAGEFDYIKNQLDKKTRFENIIGRSNPCRQFSI